MKTNEKDQQGQKNQQGKPQQTTERNTGPKPQGFGQKQGGAQQQQWGGQQKQQGQQPDKSKEAKKDWQQTSKPKFESQADVTGRKREDEKEKQPGTAAPISKGGTGFTEGAPYNPGIKNKTPGTTSGGGANPRKDEGEYDADTPDGRVSDDDGDVREDDDRNAGKAL